MRQRVATVAVACLLLGGCSGTDGPTRAPSTPITPGGFPCPAAARSSASPSATLTGGRVRVGRLSYPALSAPFTTPGARDYVPFASQVSGQDATVEDSTATSMGWRAGLTVATLASVDGPWGAERAAEVVSTCSLSMTWRGIDYQPSVARDEQTTVDGHPGWIRVTDLRFEVPGVRTRAEVQTVVTVTVGQDTYAYLSYQPQTAPELAAMIDKARAGLSVD